MKANLLLFVSVVMVLLTAPLLRADDAPTAPVAPPPLVPQADGLLPMPTINAQTPTGPVDANATVPSANFDPARYEVLWKKSPFSVATAEATTDSSPDFMLYGIANIDGTTYASLVDSHSNEHFVLSSSSPVRGLTLTSISRDPGSPDTFANVLLNGEVKHFKLQAMTNAGQPGMPQPMGASFPGPPGQPPGMAPGSIVPNIPMPGANNGPGFQPPGGARPFPRIHRPRITLPPNAPPQAPPPIPPPQNIPPPPNTPPPPLPQ